MKEGWRIVKLGEICETTAGGTPSKTHKEYYEGGKIPWMLSGEVCQKYIYEVEHYITSEGLENSSAKLFPINSVVVAMYGATAGQVGILKIETSTNQAVCGILPNDKMSPEFLYYYFLYYKDILVAQAVGNAQPNISQQKIKAVEIPLPPLEEQHRIVSILDAAFAKIDALKKNAEENLKNAKALFQQVLAQELKPKEGWEEKKLGEVLKLQSGENLPSKKMKVGKYPVYGGNGISGYHDDYNMNGHNVIIGRVGALCGNARYLTERFWLTDNGFKVKLNPEYDIDLKYLTDYLNFLNLRQYAKQAAQPVISNVALKGVKFNIPSLEEQHRIVRILDTLSEKCRRLEQIAQQTIRECDALKQSILRRAFSGEL